MILLPEIQIFTLIESVLDAIRQDDSDNIDKTKTILYTLLNGNEINGFDYYQQARSLFLREDGHSRKVAVRLSFDVQRASVPTIHITLPNEQSSFDGIGVDEGYVQSIDVGYQEKVPIYTRMFGTQYILIITSDNTFEVLLIYHVLRAMLISLFDSMEFAGLRNVKISGQDLRPNIELTPNVFMRGIGLSFNYEVSIPSFLTQKVVDILRLKCEQKPILE